MAKIVMTFHPDRRDSLVLRMIIEVQVRDSRFHPDRRDSLVLSR